MRRSIFAVVLAVAVAALSGAAIAAASSTAIHPYEGRYLGSDSHHSTVSFYMLNGKVVHFEVGHNKDFPEVHIQGHQIHHTCNHAGWCLRGQWTHDHHVTGTWNNSKTGHQGTFDVQAVSS